MLLYKKKKTSIIIEHVYLDKIIDIINESGASGFTIYDNINGEGKHGIKRGFGSLVEFSGNVEVVTISSEEVCEKLCNKLCELIDDNIHMIVHTIDAMVMRDHYFK